MLRVLPRLTLISLLVISLGTAAAGDILVGKKNGDLIECKIIKAYVKKIKGQGGPKQYIQVRLEDGTTKEYLLKDYWIIKKKPSWILRKENKEWYAKYAPKVKDTVRGQESFGFRVARKKYLDEEALIHFKKSYELRKPELKPTIGAHQGMARKLETRYGLYEEAMEEWRWVYNKKKEGVRKPGRHVGLARWCMREGLYDEAFEQYDAALKIDPRFRSALTGLLKLKKALEVPVNSQIYRIVKGPVAAALKFLKPKQNRDGSFGSDFAEAGVHGHHGMTALTGLAIIYKWEFDTLEDLDKSKTPPKELTKLLDFVLANKDTGKGLRGPDVWGPIWRLEFLAKIYKKRAFSKKKEAIKRRAVETLEELKRSVRRDGGWAYYDFVQTGITFVSASAVIAMVDAKKAGLPFDDSMIAKALQSVNSCRKKPGVYTYRPGASSESDVGCCGRSPLCELANIVAGRPTGGLKTSIQNFFRNRHLLEAIKGRSGTHIGEGKTAPYYYLFGHYWTTRAIKKLPKSLRGVYLKQMRAVFLKDQGSKGEFWDTPLTKDKEVYGTALGAMTLYELARESRKK